MSDLSATTIVSVDLDWDSYEDETGSGIAYVTVVHRGVIAFERAIDVTWGKAPDDSVVLLWARSDDSTSWLDQEADRRWIRETFVSEPSAYRRIGELIESQPWVDLDPSIVALAVEVVMSAESQLSRLQSLTRTLSDILRPYWRGVHESEIAVRVYDGATYGRPGMVRLADSDHEEIVPLARGEEALRDWYIDGCLDAILCRIDGEIDEAKAERSRVGGMPNLTIDQIDAEWERCDAAVKTARAKRAEVATLANDLRNAQPAPEPRR